MMNRDDQSGRRMEFLIEYYKVLWSNINRHIQGVWQTVTVLGGSIALLTLVGNGAISLTFAVGLIVGLSAWYAATAYDSGLWWARNQVIATNIEREFLTEEDRNRIQPYFTDHRDQPLISHFRIALWLSRGLAVTIVGYHFVEVVLPSLSAGAPFDVGKTFPYFASIIYLVVEISYHRDTNHKYCSLLENLNNYKN